MKKKLKQVTSLTLAGAITLASCSPNGTNLLNADEVLEETQKNADINDLLEKCVIELTQEDQKLMNCCIGLIDELMTDSTKAKAFIDSPQNFLAQSGNEYEGELDKGLIEMIKVLAHDDIKKAIENKDFKLFTELCRKYDVISIPQMMRDTLEIGIKSKEMKKKLPRISFEIVRGINPDLVVMQKNEWFACLGIVAVAAAVAAIYVLFWASIYTRVEAKVNGPEKPKPKEPKTIVPASPMIRFESFRNTPSALTLYKIKSHEDVNSLYIDEWVEEQYHLVDEFLMENDFDYANNTEYQNTIRQLIKGTLYKCL